MAKIEMVEGSFTPATADAAEVGEHFAKLINGTVKMQYGNVVVTAFAKKYEDDSIAVFGFIGRYRTSSKAWRVSMSRVGGQLRSHFGRDDRSGMYQKNQGITYEPQLYFKR